MSYVIDAAIAIEDRGNASSRGWYRLDPGQCRATLQSPLPSGDFYLYARVPQLYGASPLPQRGEAEFCIGSDNFSNTGARNCRGSQRPALFSAVKPVEVEQGHVITLAEEAGYDSDQARDAGIQRLLAVAGYDPGAIDGVRGEKTDIAIRQFIVRQQADRHCRRPRGFLHAIDGRGAKARHRLHLVQRHRARSHGSDRRRRRQCHHDTRLVSR